MILGSNIELGERVQLVVSQECSKLRLADVNRRWGVDLEIKKGISKMFKNIFKNSQSYVSIHTLRRSIRVSILPYQFFRKYRWGGKLGQKGVLKKWLKVFSKILNPKYQFIPWGDLSKFPSYHTSFSRKYRRWG